jgi:hypothetical protein
MENNPWSKNLRKTGLNEERITQDQTGIDNLNQRQNELQYNASNNTSKMGKYEDRQSSLAVDAMYGKQGRYNSGGKKSKRHRKTSHRQKKHKKTKKQHKNTKKHKKTKKIT